MKGITVLFCMLVFCVQSISAQNDSLETLKYHSSFWGNIFTAFYYSPAKKAEPYTGFELSTGLLGYKGQWGNKASATLIYDVYRTTDRIDVKDTNNTSMIVNYGSRGSDYTGFLKMAQIDYRINSWLDFSAGQMLNQQYLTLQDKFWGFRYIAFTFQEKYRFGAQADFGARLTFKPHKTLAVSVGSVNGNGPFRLQSNDGTLQYFTNIEWTPVKELIIKLFADHAPDKDSPSRNALSFFTGYKTDKWRIGLELNHVAKDKQNKVTKDLSGTSLYGAIRICDGWHLLARHDYVYKSWLHEKTHYFITGFEYEPYKGFYTSLNYRFMSEGDISWIYASFGVRF